MLCFADHELYLDNVLLRFDVGWYWSMYMNPNLLQWQMINNGIVPMPIIAVTVVTIVKFNQNPIITVCLTEMNASTRNLQCPDSVEIFPLTCIGEMI